MTKTLVERRKATTCQIDFPTAIRFRCAQQTSLIVYGLVILLSLLLGWWSLVSFNKHAHLAKSNGLQFLSVKLIVADKRCIVNIGI